MQTFPVEVPESTIDQLLNHGYDERVVAAEIINHGRMATSIDKVAARFDNGAEFIEVDHPANPRLPHRLEAHSTMTWVIRHERLMTSAIQLSTAIRQGSRQRVRMIVHPSTGRPVVTEQSVIIDASKR